MTGPLSDLGRCMDGWCDRPAVVYVVGPTLAASPRITVIAGPRAAQLATGDGVPHVRCVECALFAVERVAYNLTPTTVRPDLTNRRS